MKSYYLFLLFLLSCTGKQIPPVESVQQTNIVTLVPEVPSPKEPTTVHTKNWSFTFPIDWKEDISDRYNYIFFYKDKTISSTITESEEDGLMDYYYKYTTFLRSSGMYITLQRNVFVNSSFALKIEQVNHDSLAWTWFYFTGKHGVSFTCGGELTAVTRNREICDELIRGFYVNQE